MEGGQQLGLAGCRKNSIFVLRKIKRQGFEAKDPIGLFKGCLWPLGVKRMCEWAR